MSLRSRPRDEWKRQGKGAAAPPSPSHGSLYSGAVGLKPGVVIPREPQVQPRAPAHHRSVRGGIGVNSGKGVVVPRAPQVRPRAPAYPSVPGGIGFTLHESNGKRFPCDITIYIGPEDRDEHRQRDTNVLDHDKRYIVRVSGSGLDADRPERERLVTQMTRRLSMLLNDEFFKADILTNEYDQAFKTGEKVDNPTWKPYDNHKCGYRHQSIHTVIQYLPLGFEFLDENGVDVKKELTIEPEKMATYAGKLWNDSLEYVAQNVAFQFEHDVQAHKDKKYTWNVTTAWNAAANAYVEQVFFNKIKIQMHGAATPGEAGTSSA